MDIQDVRNEYIRTMECINNAIEELKKMSLELNAIKQDIESRSSH